MTGRILTTGVLIFMFTTIAVYIGLEMFSTFSTTVVVVTSLVLGGAAEFLYHFQKRRE